MLHMFPYCATVTVLGVLVYWWTTMMVGRARYAHKVEAPSTDGPPEFQRAFRAQMNTLEQIVIFLPLLWLFAAAWGDMYAAIIGIFWPIGRILFARGYIADPKKRSLGFGISFFCSAILLVGTVVGIAWRLVRSAPWTRIQPSVSALLWTLQSRPSRRRSTIQRQVPSPSTNSNICSIC